MDRYDYLLMPTLGQYFRATSDAVVKKDAKEVLNRVLSIFIHRIMETLIEDHPEGKIQTDHIIQTIETIYEGISEGIIEDIHRAIGAFNDFEGPRRTGASKKAGITLSATKIRRICLHNEISNTRIQIEAIMALTAATESFLSHLMEEVVSMTKNRKGQNLIRAVDILAISDTETDYAAFFLELIQTKI